MFVSLKVLFWCGAARGVVWFVVFLSLYSCANHKHLQGEQAKNIPGESVTEEHYMDHDGNLISRKVTYSLYPSALPGEKPQTDAFRSFLSLSPLFCLEQVIRKVIRRVSTPTPDNQGRDRWNRDLQQSPSLQEDEPEVGMNIRGEKGETSRDRN